ncbi:MAG: hypothetical protein Kow0042_24140 [Calditrichia bacterium]
MNGLAASQLDIFLTFSDLRLLVFSSQWKLIDLRPAHRNFLGWDETTIDSFNFNQNFLEPNHLQISEFLGHFLQKEHALKNYYWRDIHEQISGPYETYFKIKKEKGQIKSLMAFVKMTGKVDRVMIEPQKKYSYFLGLMLPGFIHNLNGPLGTLTGRIELLNIKYQKIAELNELLKMGFKLQNIIENLSFKLVNERYFQPVEINLNRLLREEITFLQADLFFKHQVTVQEKFFNNIPQFRMYYLALSGVLSECYHFFRNFVYEDQEYSLHVGSFCEDKQAGYYLNFLGEFRIPENLSLRFPISLSGDAVKMAQSNVEGLDTAFLTYCLKYNQGFLQVTCRKEMLTMRLQFPILK